MERLTQLALHREEALLEPLGQGRERRNPGSEDEFRKWWVWRAGLAE
jgi:hypothetical protein